jgi:nitrate/TMAO reductase-like tetraheme cytochrome c subunit
LPFTQIKTTSCAVCRRLFRASAEMWRAPEEKSHECLSCHHIAPAARKTAACTSSPGPVWLVILRCG